jgi:hypothetical protein
MEIVVVCLLGALLGGAAGWAAARLQGHRRAAAWATAGAWFGFIIVGAALMIRLAMFDSW